MNTKFEWDPTNLQYLFDNCGVSVRQICEATGITPKSIKEYLSKDYLPGITNIVRLADVFAVPMDFICGRCTLEESEKIKDSFKENFRILRKEDYENLILKKKLYLQDFGNYEPTWPYNLLDDIFRKPFDHIVSEDELNGLQRAIETLTLREQDAVYKHYREEMSLREVSAEFGVGPERVRQILAKAVRKLRHPSRSKTILYGDLGNKKRLELIEKETELLTLKVKLKRMEEELEEKMREAEIKIDEKHIEDSMKVDDVLDIPIEELDLSVRSFNCLKRSNINTVRDIIEHIRKGTLAKIRNYGVKSADETIRILMEKTGFTEEEIIGCATSSPNVA